MTGKPIIKNPNAVALGALGGSKKSAAKTVAARANIKKRWDKVRSQASVSPS